MTLPLALRLTCLPPICALVAALGPLSAAGFTPSIVGTFEASGQLSGTATENGVTLPIGYAFGPVLMEFTAAHGADVGGLFGTWKQKKANTYGANCSGAMKANVAGTYPDCKIKAKLLLKKLEIVGDDFAAKLVRNYSAKKPGYHFKLKSSVQLLGTRT